MIPNMEIGDMIRAPTLEFERRDGRRGERSPERPCQARC
jgi:hypothetical protein